LFQYIKFFLLLAIAWSIPFLLIPNIQGLTIELQFIIVTVTVMLLGYYFQWVNQDSIQKTGEIEYLLQEKRKVDFSQVETEPKNIGKLVSYLGHILLFFIALMVAYGVVTHHAFIVFLAVIPWWYVDDIMLKRWIEKLTNP